MQINAEPTAPGNPHSHILQRANSIVSPVIAASSYRDITTFSRLLLSLCFSSGVEDCQWRD